MLIHDPVSQLDLTLFTSSQIRQGIANNSKGTAFVVYEDVHDAKQACDKLNGFNFQNRYLVGTCYMGHPDIRDRTETADFRAFSIVSPARKDDAHERGPLGEAR
jgi:pre-mRNA branch site protein p14